MNHAKPSSGRPRTGKPWDNAATRTRRSRETARKRGLVRVEALLPADIAQRLQDEADAAGISRAAWIAALLAK